MKCFFPLIIEAIKNLDTGKFRQPLTIIATADEETTMAGARSLLKSGITPGRYAVIGEPTGLIPVRMHKGVLMEAIRIRGRSGHSSNPDLGSSAIEGMHNVIAALLQWRKDLQEEYRNTMFEVSQPTMNLGHIHGGDNPNRICADCELHLDLRPLPGMSLEVLRETLREKVVEALIDTDLKIETRSLFSGIPAMDTSSTSEVVQVAERLTGKSSGTVAFGTEGPFFNELGVETVVLGPGNIDQAHQPDEYVDRDRLGPAVDLFEQMINHFCMRPEEVSRKRAKNAD
jgi:acetylornithine deacetylase